MASYVFVIHLENLMALIFEWYSSARRVRAREREREEIYSESRRVHVPMCHVPMLGASVAHSTQPNRVNVYCIINDNSLLYYLKFKFKMEMVRMLCIMHFPFSPLTQLLFSLYAGHHGQCVYRCSSKQVFLIAYNYYSTKQFRVGNVSSGA